MRQTYKIVNQLLNKEKKSVLPSHSDEKELADRFAIFFNDKVKKH